MTTQDKALAMVREEDGKGYLNYDAAIAALCRAIEQHEAFQQKVSDAIVEAFGDGVHPSIEEPLRRFIIPAPKPDPLLGIVEWLGGPVWGTREEYVKEFRAALEARGLEIREKNDD